MIHREVILIIYDIKIPSKAFNIVVKRKNSEEVIKIIENDRL